MRVMALLEVVDVATTTAAVHDRSFYVDAVGELKAGTYSLFDAFAILKYKGNTTRAAKDIERLGFGGMRMPSLNIRELMADDRNIDYLIDKVMIAGKPFMGFGQSKCLKTLLTVDMAVSLATQTDFLGRFKVNPKCSVLFMSGESGLDIFRKRTIAVCSHGASIL